MAQIKCPNCGNEYDESLPYCEECGCMTDQTLKRKIKRKDSPELTITCKVNGKYVPHDKLNQCKVTNPILQELANKIISNANERLLENPK